MSFINNIKKRAKENKKTIVLPETMDDRVLKAAGVTKDNVVQCRIYISDVSYWDAINEVYGKFFGEHKPARVVVPVPALHFGCLVEIEAVAEMEG